MSTRPFGNSGHFVVSITREHVVLTSTQAVQESQVSFTSSHAHSTTPGHSAGFPPKFKSAGDSFSQSLRCTRDEYEPWVGICSLNFPQRSELLTFNFLVQTHLQRLIPLGKTGITH